MCLECARQQPDCVLSQTSHLAQDWPQERPAAMGQWVPHMPAPAVGPAVRWDPEALRATIRQGGEAMPAAAMRTAVPATQVGPSPPTFAPCAHVHAWSNAGTTLHFRQCAMMDASMMEFLSGISASDALQKACKYRALRLS